MVFITNKSVCLYRNTGVFFVLMMCWLACSAQSGNNSMYDYSSKVDSVLSLMTLDEKIGQLNQYTGNWQATGPVVEDSTKIEQIKAGRVGAMLNIKGVKYTREMQNYAMQSRLRIPLLFGQDVIHGLRTIYPIPLGEAASFDLDLMERTAAGAAEEASAQGIHWTFAPMVDITRDARWGRVMEGAGEDTWYGSRVAEARVRGFQGDDLADTHTVMACAKHFAAYGAAIAGKDYNTVDISDLTLHDTYLPPFRAAANAGVATFMNSFNDINGIPATGNAYIQRDILKEGWAFSGFIVSDWGSVKEMVAHGYASDLKASAEIAIHAGCDMDMESRAYQTLLPDAPREGIVINIAELRLYYYPPGKNSVTVYPIGIGQLGGDTLTPTMVTTVSDKRANPTWTPTANIRARYKAQGIELPAVVPAGPDNPMGHHAIRLAAYGGVYLLHGTNADFGIGMRVSSGCIRLRDDDIKTLFSQVTPGTKVNIINTPIKVSAEPNGARLVEVHQPLSEKIDDDPQLLPITLNSAMQSFKDAAQTDAEVMQHVMDVRSGMPVDVRRHQVSPQTL